jgi:hypothetical protein
LLTGAVQAEKGILCFKISLIFIVVRIRLQWLGVELARTFKSYGRFSTYLKSSPWMSPFHVMSLIVVQSFNDRDWHYSPA